MKRNKVDLVGSREIAERIGLAHPEGVHTWRQRHADFPAPLARLAIGYVWDWSDIESWAVRTGRLNGRKGAKR